MLLSGFNVVLTLLSVAMLVLAVVAFVFALLTRDDAFRAAGKRSKLFWLILLGAVIAVDLFLNFVFLQIAGVVASIVYLVDVRPAVRQVTGGGGSRIGLRGFRRRGGGSSSDGPYGPYNGRR